MKFNKLRLVGFKSFVEATDFEIKPGLTGVVGPNGCGKSNLVEAMRWVMGESSYKSLRGAGMEDVIFSGSGGRPARNVAEVSLTLDNDDRVAPAAFNDADLLEVTRRIVREEGSNYRVNGRDVRARDVQLLFADASTGSRSPAMVRQGQIGEIISAKPQARRRILEEAAGVAGLHSRRHEAELRLKAAEDNLVRLDDVLKQIEAQIESLKRQARQATRYKSLAADIRRAQALLFHISHVEAARLLAEATHTAETDLREVAARTGEQAQAVRQQAVAAHGLPDVRDREARAAAALQRLVNARDQLDAEEKRARERVAQLERMLSQAVADVARETALIEDAAGVLARLDEEERGLASQSADDDAATATAGERLARARAALGTSEAMLTQAQTALADLQARRATLDNNVRDSGQRIGRIDAEATGIGAEITRLEAESQTSDAARLAAQLAQAGDSARALEAAATAAEENHRQARDAEMRLRGPHGEAERKAQRLETEARTLSKMLDTDSGGLWPPVVDSITVEKGWEAALGAALGDDLDASLNTSAPAYWAADAGVPDDPLLPRGIASLADRVDAPKQLARALAQIGIVQRSDAAQVAPFLKAGQRIVTKEGDLWRWDGFVSAAEAPSAAARRLVEKNRLGDLRREASEARAIADAHKLEADAAQEVLRAAGAAESIARQAHRQSLHVLETAREAHAQAERARARVAERLSAVHEARARLAASRAEALAAQTRAQDDLVTLAAPADLTAQLDGARAAAAQDRVELAEARAASDTLGRDMRARETRRQAIAADSASWSDRRARAEAHMAEHADRESKAAEELRALDDAPALFLQRRRALVSEIIDAEAAVRTAGDARAEAESAAIQADRAARAALEALATAREDHARSGARVEAQTLRLADVTRAIASELDCEPQALAALAGVKPEAGLPELAQVERRLDALKGERERLGAVNLRADDELVEIEASRAKLIAERDDLIEAIKRLRQAIGSLNREGRERLLAAFDVVNGHFKQLFETLFGGGSAELQLIESDDPLEAGLEILAKPPGKKPQTMTLLSGGEQALTAMSLIFAVFLTNPSPICVLDEVDAPLDDANVERFCDLLDDMCKRTDTRFITITHNPITMARMDRLYGVTMAERGVSQLVSVNLQEAERFLEAV